MRKKTAIAAALLMLSLPSFADTIIKQKDPDGSVTTTSIKGNTVRMDIPGEKAWQLWDLKTGTFYLVDPENRTITTMEFGKKGKQQEASEGKVHKIGKGPKIAGFSTIEYKLEVDGRQCGKEYVSPDAAKPADIRHLLKGMAKVGSPESMLPEGMGAAIRAFQDPCDAASLSFGKQLAAKGMPMRSIDTNGNVETEVTAIDTHATLDASQFKLPADYKRTSVEAEVNDAMNEMKQMMQNMKDMPPEAQQFMQQLFQAPK